MLGITLKFCTSVERVLKLNVLWAKLYICSSYQGKTGRRFFCLPLPILNMVKHGITAPSGIIDSDYCGVACVILFNSSKVDYLVLSGQRIGQLIIKRNISVKFVEVVDSEKTERTQVVLV